MGPFHIQAFLEIPIAGRRAHVGRQRTARPTLVEDGEGRIAGGVERRQAIIRAEGGDVRDNVRVVVCVDDGDRLPRAIAGGSVERDQVGAVSALNIDRRERRGWMVLGLFCSIGVNVMGGCACNWVGSAARSADSLDVAGDALPDNRKRDSNHSAT